MVKFNLKKTGWSEIKKETKLIVLRDKKRKNVVQIVVAGLKQAQINTFFIGQDA